MKEFGLPGAGAHIINGHIPVIVKKGESPVKCGGKLLVIDGGFSKAYQPKTGIAGYTLIYNSYGLVLAAHEPFTSMEDTVLNETCIHSHIVMEQNVVKRKTDKRYRYRKGIAGEYCWNWKNCCRRIEVVCWWRSSEKQNNEIRKRNQLILYLF